MAAPLRSNVFPTGDIYDDALLFGGWRWGQPGGGKVDITYNFSNKYDDWTPREKGIFRAALDSYAQVLNITFKEVSSVARANWIEYSVDDNFPGSNGVLGAHGLPIDAAGLRNPAFGSNNQAFGYFNWEHYTPTSNGFDSKGLVKGGYAYNTFVHEIGHALGLAHPFGPNFGYGSFPDVDDANDYGYRNFNQGIFTAMSYNYGWEKEFDPEGNGIGNRGYVGGPMAFDIHALLNLYAPNQASNGNNTYKLTDTLAYWKTIYDVGGIDTLVYTGTRATTISLNEISPHLSENAMMTRLSGKNAGFLIAFDVSIERAVGGAGNDLILGNAADNFLSGRGGNDTLEGGDGGNDRLLGGDGNDSLTGLEGRDFLQGGNGDDALAGEHGTVSGPGSQGNENDDRLYGDAGNDYLDGHLGNDYLSGGPGNDQLRGGLQDGWGKDILDGGPGDDELRGGPAGDIIRGGLGRDILLGDDGGSAYDGADVFDFNSVAESGVTDLTRDHIWDFRPDQGDMIDLRNIDADETQPGNQLFHFDGQLTGIGFSGSPGQLGYFRPSDALILIAADVDGDRQSDFEIQVHFIPTEGVFLL